MPESNPAKYIDYFRQMAVNHPDIAHDPLSETPDGDPQKKRFTRWSADEVVTSLRNQIGWPGLLLEMYEVATSAANVYDVRFRPKGAFTVLDHAEPQNTADEVRCFQETDIIIRDILKKIWDHHYGPEVDRCSTPFKEFRFESIQITPVGPLFENEFGFRVEFDFEFHDGVKLNEYASGADPFLNDF